MQNARIFKSVKMINIVVYQSHMLWPYNSRITLMKWFTFIHILEVSKIQRILYEKLNFWKLISGDIHKCNFLFYSIFLFSESNAVLSHRNRVKFQDLREIQKKSDDFNIFHQNFKQMCACSNVLMRKGSRFKHKQSVWLCYEWEKQHLYQLRF